MNKSEEHLNKQRISAESRGLFGGTDRSGTPCISHTVFPHLLSSTSILLAAILKSAHSCELSSIPLLQQLHQSADFSASVIHFWPFAAAASLFLAPAPAPVFEAAVVPHRIHMCTSTTALDNMFPAMVHCKDIVGIQRK